MGMLLSTVALLAKKDGLPTVDLPTGDIDDLECEYRRLKKILIDGVKPKRIIDQWF